MVAISMSWGSNENTGQLAYDSHFTTIGKAYFASSGDVGGVVSWPSSSPNVVSVGGTKLTMTTTGYTETAWSAGGGGVSSIETVPNYQKGVTDSYSSSKRATPDVSYNADPSTGFLVYDSYGYNGGRGWFIVGGTSAGAPQWAAIFTFGNSATNVNFYANYPNRYGTTFSDVVGGSNGYTAVSGYDLATGIGSPIGVNFGAPPTPDFTVSASPNSLTTNAGTQTTTNINVNSIAGFSGIVSLSTVIPSGWTVDPLTNSISSPGSYPLAITPSSDAKAGTYTITVTGNSGSLTHSATITVTVKTPDYSLTANPTSLSIRQGSSGTAQITVNPLNGYTGTVTLSAKTTTSRITFSFNPNPTTPGTPSTLTITVPSSTSRGTYTVTITGSDTAGLTHQTTIRLTVNR